MFAHMKMPPNKTHSHSEHVEGNTKKASIFTIFVCHSGLKMKKKIVHVGNDDHTSHVV